ncbi:MAG: RluA family pseudouridine synthase [Gammaproteobacteria bacterium]|nr:RluA family pseudouridine synthase [Gammaproteobacteria bacterium]
MHKIKLYCEKDITLKDLLDENNISRKLRRSLKAKGQIKKDNKVLYLSSLLKKGDIVTLYVDEDNSDIKPVEMPLNIKYESDDIMVIDKDYGISVMSTMNMNEICLINGVQDYLLKKGISSKVHLINRLDRLTTGLMLLTKNRFSASLMSDSLKKTLKRKYYAIVDGILDEKEGEIILPIVKESSMTVRRVVRNDGKESITRYKVIKEFDNASLLDIELLTGRTHQIRVTFSYIHHPLIGDKMYNYNPRYDELLLHSHYIEFIEPKTNELIKIETGIPERFNKFIKENDGKRID